MWRNCLILFVVLVVPCLTARIDKATWEVVRMRRQIGGLLCTLPPYPENGNYSLEGNSTAGPGDQVSSAQLLVSCNPGYRPSGDNLIHCMLGTWSEELPKCIRFCKLDPHPSVKYECQVTSDESEEIHYRDCNSHEPTGTVVRPQCNEPNYHFTGVLAHMRCNEGSWNYIAICQPECGTVTPDGKGLIIHGRDSKRGEFPWHAVIYQKSLSKDTTKHRQICGGSLVSRSIVISAAHCFWDNARDRIHPISSYAVALGKFYRRWNNTLDDEAQKFDVVDIKVPARFIGAGSYFQDDIAILWLSKPAVYAPNVRPVCLDFDPDFDALQLKDGNFGKIAGWGLKNLEEHAPTLQVTELPFMRTEKCIKESPSTFRPLITSDKICAGYSNGSVLCRGDGGGGWVFMARDDGGVERYYLRGVVATAPASDQVCNAFTIAGFTKITKHKDFIEKNIGALGQSSAVPPETDA